VCRTAVRPLLEGAGGHPPKKYNARTIRGERRDHHRRPGPKGRPRRGAHRLEHNYRAQLILKKIGFLFTGRAPWNRPCCCRSVCNRVPPLEACAASAAGLTTTPRESTRTRCGPVEQAPGARGARLEWGNPLAHRLTTRRRSQRAYPRWRARPRLRGGVAVGVAVVVLLVAAAHCDEEGRAAGRAGDWEARRDDASQDADGTSLRVEAATPSMDVGASFALLLLCDVKSLSGPREDDAPSGRRRPCLARGESRSPIGGG
jgi:hypothetical protein